MSLSDLLDEWFESEQLKGLLAVNGIIGTWAGPDEPGTAYVMLHHVIGDVGDGKMGSWGFPQAGRVLRFVEKPAEPPSGLACPPLYVFEPPALARLPEFLRADSRVGDPAPGERRCLTSRSYSNGKPRGRRAGPGSPGPRRSGWWGAWERSPTVEPRLEASPRLG
jgi:hypothetical protein